MMREYPLDGEVGGQVIAYRGHNNLEIAHLIEMAAKNGSEI